VTCSPAARPPRLCGQPGHATSVGQICADVRSRRRQGRLPRKPRLPPDGSEPFRYDHRQCCFPLRETSLPLLPEPFARSAEAGLFDAPSDSPRSGQRPRATRCICGSPSQSRRTCKACFPILLRASLPLSIRFKFSITFQAITPNANRINAEGIFSALVHLSSFAPKGALPRLQPLLQSFKRTSLSLARHYQRSGIRIPKASSHCSCLRLVVRPLLTEPGLGDLPSTTWAFPLSVTCLCLPAGRPSGCIICLTTSPSFSQSSTPVIAS
jgi:hypothetical protein